MNKFKNKISLIYFIGIFNLINIFIIYILLELIKTNGHEAEVLSLLIFSEPFLLIHTIAFSINRYKNKKNPDFIIFLPIITLIISFILLNNLSIISCQINVYIRCFLSLLSIISLFRIVRK